MKDDNDKDPEEQVSEHSEPGWIDAEPLEGQTPLPQDVLHTPDENEGQRAVRGPRGHRVQDHEHTPARRRERGAEVRRRSAARPSSEPGTDNWPRMFDGATPEEPEKSEPAKPRRRAEDANAPEEDESSETLLSRSRRLAGKYGKSLVGLGVAGVAMPVAHALDNAAAQHQQHTAAPEAGQAPKVNVVERQTPAAAGSQAAREDNIGQHWKGLKRGNIVQSAMQAFGIDQGLAEKIHDFAVQAGIEPQLGYGLVHTESTFKPTAKSYVGALGLTQLMPRTAAWLQPGTSKSDLVKPEVNLPLGFKYLKSLIDRYNGNTRMALLAYNRGPGIVDRVLKSGGDPNNGYADKVLGGAGRVQDHT